MNQTDKTEEPNNYESFNDIVNTITEDMLLELSSISQRKTGLDVIVWVQTYILQTNQHNTPRIRFQNNTAIKPEIKESIPMSISDEPKILLKSNDLDKISLTTKQIASIKEWIVRNKDILLKHWNAEITSYDVFVSLK
ncbi:MAG: hypothetical protein J6W06_04850 [Bacteroidales bacterium]|nr:hypothetical protein [Bacteroidales bacterium]